MRCGVKSFCYDSSFPDRFDNIAFSLCAASSRTFRSCGRNIVGQPGLTDANHRNSPTAIPGLPGIKAGSIIGTSYPNTIATTHDSMPGRSNSIKGVGPEFRAIRAPYHLKKSEEISHRNYFRGFYQVWNGFCFFGLCCLSRAKVWLATTCRVSGPRFITTNRYTTGPESTDSS